jgi:hypothetical protein
LCVASANSSDTRRTNAAAESTVYGTADGGDEAAPLDGLLDAVIAARDRVPPVNHPRAR